MEEEGGEQTRMWVVERYDAGMRDGEAHVSMVANDNVVGGRWQAQSGTKSLVGRRRDPPSTSYQNPSSEDEYQEVLPEILNTLQAEAYQ